MASYATRAELVQLSVSAAAISSISTAAQDAALDSASRRADSYLRGRFDLPLSGWGTDLKQAVCDIAAYNILKVRGWSPESGDAEHYLKAYSEAIRWLENVAKGNATPIDVVDSSSGGVNSTTEARNAPSVLQTNDEAVGRSDFWGTSVTQGGGIGNPPKRRGW